MPSLDWIGKASILNHHNEIPYRLVECNEVIGDLNAGNLIVKGDNLLALKALLPYYKGKVKMIYIDPPYNTGNESWVYNDAVNSPEIKAWLGRTVGSELEDLCRHDKWLCMIYPRLKLLRDFLQEDGIIFTSIDSNEHRYLELIMDEIFGSQNRIETLIWKKSYGGGAKSKHVVNLHEYILCFAKNKAVQGVWELPPTEKALKYYKYKDDKFSIRGPYRLQPLATNSMDERPNLRYSIPFEGIDVWPEKQWQWSKERAYLALENDELVFTKKSNKITVSYKQYLKDSEGTERGSKAYSIIEEIYTQKGTSEMKEFFDNGKAFSFPKPRELVQKLLQIATKSGDIVLDSFAGSGTTGHAVLAQNKEDNGQRKFVLVEMEDYARDITAERVKRVMDGYGSIDGTGGGFRFCELGEPIKDENGALNPEVSAEALAKHLFFSEYGVPLETKATLPYIGSFNESGLYLFFDTFERKKLAKLLKDSNESRIVYAASCTIDPQKLKDAGITFRQLPFEIKDR